MSGTPITNKIVAVGDGAVGKTCLLMVYATNEFPTEYIPTVFENYATQIKYEGKVVSMSLWDTAGQEEYDQLRNLSYPGADVFLLCFSLVSESSFENVKLRWVKELREKCDKTHKYGLVLVGTKVDMRDDTEYVKKMQSKREKVVTTEMGIELAKEIGAFGYFETSARNMTKIEDVFQSCLDYKFQKKGRGKSCKQQ
ncbi:Ras-related protein Rac [Acrasis kona]|uniref:Ras-related protein Rac n=1 Tax=Acrasis kona TaxID=1008807 RepID=A0AAW2Z8C5_9EUKA